jgi:hypothetical protein
VGRTVTVSRSRISETSSFNFFCCCLSQLKVLYIDFLGTRQVTFKNCIYEHANGAFLAFSRYLEVYQC